MSKPYTLRKDPSAAKRTRAIESNLLKLSPDMRPRAKELATQFIS